MCVPISRNEMHMRMLQYRRYGCAYTIDYAKILPQLRECWITFRASENVSVNTLQRFHFHVARLIACGVCCRCHTSALVKYHRLFHATPHEVYPAGRMHHIAEGGFNHSMIDPTQLSLSFLEGGLAFESVRLLRSMEQLLHTRLSSPPIPPNIPV